MDLSLIFKVVIGFTVIQRIAELFWAKRNEKIILSEGGHIVPEKNYIFMVILHTSWLLGLVWLAFFRELSFEPVIFYPAIVAFLLGQTLRITAISTLGKRWSTRVVILPKAPVVKKGLFSFIRHPNYTGVVIELAALPLAAGLWVFALVFSLLNFIILYFRIHLEEEMLCKHNDYGQKFGVSRS